MKKLYSLAIIFSIISVFALAQGDDCFDPIVVNIPADLPYSDINQSTCGLNDDYSGTCINPYDKSLDIIYRLDVSTQTEILVNMDPKGYSSTGILIDNECPNGNICLVYYSSPGNELRTITVVLDPGTYYLMIDCKSGCFNFDLTIEEVIPPPEFEIKLVGRKKSEPNDAVSARATTKTNQMM